MNKEGLDNQGDHARQLPRRLHPRELDRAQEALRKGTSAALNASTFLERRKIMGRTVASVSARLAAHSLSSNPDQTTPELERVFRAAANEAGQAFETFFDKRGRARGKRGLDSRYFDVEGPMRQGRDVARRHWNAALRAIGIDYDQASLDELFNRAQRNFPHSLEITHHALELPPPRRLEQKEVRARLSRAIPLHEKPHYRQVIDELPFSPSPPLTPQELAAVSVLARLGQAIWLAQQPQRAVFEEDPTRTDPASRGTFQPFDRVIIENYRTHSKVHGPQTGALGTALVEISKDLGDHGGVGKTRKPGK